MLPQHGLTVKGYLGGRYRLDATSRRDVVLKHPLNPVNPVQELFLRCPVRERSNPIPVRISESSPPVLIGVLLSVKSDKCNLQCRIVSPPDGIADSPQAHARPPHGIASAPDGVASLQYQRAPVRLDPGQVVISTTAASLPAMLSTEPMCTADTRQSSRKSKPGRTSADE